MKPATKIISTSPRGASAEELAQFSANVAADLRELAQENEALRNQLRVLGERFSQESLIQSAVLGGLRSQVDVLSKLGASRAELEQLAAIMAAPSVPQDLGYAFLPLAGIPGSQLQLDGAALEDGALTLPLTSRRSLLFGNDPLTGKVVLPEDLVAVFQPLDEGTVQSAASTPARLALSDDALEPFARTVRLAAGRTQEAVSGRLDVTIPPSMKGSLRLNLIELVPYPLWSTTITAIRLYSPSGSSLMELSGNWSGPVTLPVTAGGPTGVGRIQLDLVGAYPSYEGGHKVFRYGVSKLGLYEASYASRGSFRVGWSVGNGQDLKTIQGLVYNSTGGAIDLIRRGQLRLKIEVPGGGREADGWALVYDTDVYLGRYSDSGFTNSFFPAGGMAIPAGKKQLRISGELRTASGERPSLTDLLVTYTQ